MKEQFETLGLPVTVRVPVSFDQEDSPETKGELSALDLAVQPLLDARYPGGPSWLAKSTTRELTYTWGQYEAVLKEHLLTQFPNDGELP